ncbi:branched-chain amino acid transport system II carrier protein [bacterium]|nr:branched-chain amino acid transport system II carrier protein [bacterium]
MTKKTHTQTQQMLTIGLAIFSMLFGAGNIIYPIKAGVLSGSQNVFGMLGFILTGVLLPVIGLITMILFDGNYRRFFSRIGRIPGSLGILYCMLIIGPLIAMPRCITVPYEMLSPFLPDWITLTLFSIIFGSITLLLTYKESNLLDILGKFISPVLVGSLVIIIVKGLYNADSMIPQSKPALDVFQDQLFHGFQTLDLLGSLFFAYIVLKIMKANKLESEKPKDIALTGLKAGLIGGGLLALIYVGFSYLGAYYGYIATADANGAQIFRNICLMILPEFGMYIIVTAVLMACLSTITALAAVFSEYLHYDVFYQKVPLTACLVITTAMTVFISNFGLSTILQVSEPIINIGYPIIISITLFNLLYKLFDFKPIKLPVLLCSVGIISWYLYLWM